MAQGQGMREDAIAGPQPAHRRPCGEDDAGGLDAQRHRNPRADVPAARADDLVPVPDPRRPDFHQDLIGGQRLRLVEVEHRDWAADFGDARA
jgi:hypothetical protein